MTGRPWKVPAPSVHALNRTHNVNLSLADPYFLKIMCAGGLCCDRPALVPDTEAAYPRIEGACTMKSRKILFVFMAATVMACAVRAGPGRAVAHRSVEQA